MDESVEVERLEVLARVARELAKGVVHLQKAPGAGRVDAHQRHPDWSILKGALEARLGVPQRQLCALPVRDVTLDRRDPYDTAPRVLDRGRAHRDRDQAAILPEPLGLVVIDAPSGEEL